MQQLVALRRQLMLYQRLLAADDAAAAAASASQQQQQQQQQHAKQPTRCASDVWRAVDRLVNSCCGLSQLCAVVQRRVVAPILARAPAPTTAVGGADRGSRCSRPVANNRTASSVAY